MGSQRTGKTGEDIVLKLPAGTEILDEDEETVIADLTTVGQRVLLARGGNGGWGNLQFKSSTNRSPTRANPGQEGVERTLWLRLKLIAEVGQRVVLLRGGDGGFDGAFVDHSSSLSFSVFSLFSASQHPAHRPPISGPNPPQCSHDGRGPDGPPPPVD